VRPNSYKRDKKTIASTFKASKRTYKALVVVKVKLNEDNKYLPKKKVY